MNDTTTHCTVGDLVNRWDRNCNHEEWFSILCEIEFPLVAVLNKMNDILANDTPTTDAYEAQLSAIAEVERSAVIAYSDVPIRLYRTNGQPVRS